MLRVFVFVFSVLLTGGAALAEERVALVIGNSDYQQFDTLENPRNDALDIAVALRGLGFTVTLETDVTKDRMDAVLRDFGNAAEEADVVLFFYAGHGFQADGRNYLVPADATIRSTADVTTQTADLSRVLNAMERSDGVKLVLLDACRDNPFGAALEQDPRLGKGLARVGTAANFLFAYATQPDNVAYDGTGRNSFFTEALLHHIYTPGQDIAQMMIGVRRDVLAATGGRQIPWENSSLTRRFQFDDGPQTISEESMLYQLAVNAGDPQLLTLYVDRYPAGSHIDEAVAHLQTGTQTRALNLADDADRLWELARRSRMRPLLEVYVERYPQGLNVDEAQRLLASIPRPEDALPGTICQRLATHPRDATAENPGVPFDRLSENALNAIRACSAAAARSPELPHYVALLARATAASGDLRQAVRLYRDAAGRGDLRAMVSLAQLYETGTGVEMDVQAAITLYRTAAEAGSHDAMINLAISLLEGTGGAADSAGAIALLKRASSEGSAKATYNLGVLAQNEQVDAPADALEYFTRAAHDGAREGYLAAAILLDEGRGIDRDPQGAANMLLRGAAEDRGEILGQLTDAADQWSRETIAAVQERLKDAGYYTSTVDGLPGRNFTAALVQWRNGGFVARVLVN
ncbi:caspase family protein [Puniceibacterium sp. IMCC21224]|uniref:caspase family protein n=1 Tax=Puniceibacterium sp. IMCC21224 TaxID=1618204 RepID=UPI001E409673|nr:caspase family protein [Puniceibacterium sp. IMCC21224]